MSDLPAPLVPADVDLRDFAFMPVDIVRLFDSDFHAQSNDAEWRAGFTLWLRSYHQVPAGSLPDDDVALARLAELGRDVKSWRKVRAGALRGWTKCSDGRLYHRTVCEKALEGWIEKLLQRKSSAAGNAKRYGHPFDATEFDAAISDSLTMLAKLNPQSRIIARRVLKAPAGTADGSATGTPDGAPGGRPGGRPGGTPGGTPTKPPDCRVRESQGTSKGQGTNRSSSLRSDDARAARSVFDEEFWPRYPNKVGKPTACKAFEKLWREMAGVVAPILCGLERYVRDKPPDRPWLNPATFLNQRRFEDQPAAADAKSAGSVEPRIDFGGGTIWPESSVRSAVARCRTDPTSWPSSILGPPPLTAGCKVPQRLLEEAA